MNGPAPDLSPDELEREIRHILDRGLIRPKGFWQYLVELHRTLGIRYLFFGTGSTGIITALTLLALLLYLPLPGPDHLYAVLFLLSPVSFLMLMLLTETTEKVNGVYELKMTLTYTVRQLAVIRILYFSLIGCLFSAYASVYLGHALQIMDMVLKLLALSLSALFLCAFVCVYAMRHFHSRWSHFAALGFWFLAGLLPYAGFNTHWNAFLKQMPLALTVVVALGAVVLLLIEVKKTLILHTSEVI